MRVKASSVWEVRSGRLGLHPFIEAQLAEHVARLQAGTQVVKVLNQAMEPLPDYDISYRPKLFFQLVGCNHVTFPDGELFVEPGDMFIIQSGTPHRERRVYHRKRYAHVYCNVSPQRFVYNAYVLCQNPSKKQHHIASSFTDNEKNAFVLRLINELCDIQATDSPAASALSQSLAQSILLQLTMVLQHPYWEGELHPLVRRCKTLIQEQLQNPQLTVSHLAEQLGVHPDYLSRIFSEHEQQRLVPYLVECRINLAKEILRNLNVRIDEVSALCGFAERGYFAKVFRRSTGMTPTAYRAEGNAPRFSSQ